MKECIFCKICQNQLPSYKIWEDKNYLAFLSIYPNTKGITVVAPKEHYSSYIFDQSPEVVDSIMVAAKNVSDILVNKFDTVARVGIVFEGYGVDHLHVKLFPLHGTKGPWNQIKSNINTKFETYPGYISTHDVDRESDVKLEEIANLLRQK